MVREGDLNVVDLKYPPGLAESSFLCALFTAVCRPSLHLAPGVLVSAPAVTGAGAGKGLMVRCIAEVAFGVQPPVFTAGHDQAELDKRLVAALIEGGPMVCLDNVNGITLRSDTLASVLTERPATVRELGRSKMIRLDSAAFISVTGNGVTVAEDLARRYLTVELDPRCEDPEARPFRTDLLAAVRAARAMLLGAALTIWRYGRQAELPRGIPMGSFEQWAVRRSPGKIRTHPLDRRSSRVSGARRFARRRPGALPRRP
jgi:hypothetical protein